MRALYSANFQEARNINDVAVLADVAAPHGFTSDEVARLTADERELGETREEARPPPRPASTACRCSSSASASPSPARSPNPCCAPP